jgi:ABC-type microcin C transport system permease subunit YejB
VGETHVTDPKMDRGLWLFAVILGTGIVIVILSGFIPALRDYTMIMAVTMFLAILMVFANLITDIVYKAIDPRITFE